MTWIARRVDDRVRFVPVQSDEGAEALKAVGLNALDPESFLVVKDGQCLQKSTAVIAALNVVGGGWKIAALLLGLLPTRLQTEFMIGSPPTDTSGSENARRVLFPGRKATFARNEDNAQIGELRT